MSIERREEPPGAEKSVQARSNSESLVSCAKLSITLPSQLSVVPRLMSQRRDIIHLKRPADGRFQPSETSHIHRLTDDDRARSLDEPGGVSGIMGVPTTVVYAFENEELHDIVNFTGHHFLPMSMEPAAQGYTVYWAIYTKKAGWFTSLCMVLIDPFRRALVYPLIIRKIERAWVQRYRESSS